MTLVSIESRSVNCGETRHEAIAVVEGAIMFTRTLSRLDAFRSAALHACDQEEEAVFMSREELIDRARNPYLLPLYDWFLGSPGESWEQVAERLEVAKKLMVTSCSAHDGWANDRMRRGVDLLDQLASHVRSDAFQVQAHDLQQLTNAHLVARHLGSCLGGVLHCKLCWTQFREGADALSSPAGLVTD